MMDDPREEKPVETLPPENTSSALPEHSTAHPAEGGTAPEAQAGPPERTDEPDDEPGIVERLRAAWEGFFRGLRGLPVSIPPGEEGTIPVAEAMHTQRRLERKLEKARGVADKLRDEVAELKRAAEEHSGEARRTEREWSRVRDQATQMEESLRRDLESSQGTVREKNEALGNALGELDLRREELKQAAASLVSTQQQLEKTQAQAEERESVSREELGRAAAEISAGQEALAALREEAGRAAQAATEELAAAKDAVRSRGAEMEGLRGDVSRLEVSLREVREETARQLQPLREELEQAQRAAAEAETVRQSVAGELETARAQGVAAAESRSKAAQAERELGKRIEENDALRGDVRGKLKRISELEAKLKSAEQAQAERDSLQRDLKQRMLQFEAMHENYGAMQARAEKLKKIIEEFQASAVSAIQVASVYADFADKSKTLAEADRENVTEMKQGIERLRQGLLKLAAQIAEPEKKDE